MRMVRTHQPREVLFFSFVNTATGTVKSSNGCIHKVINNNLAFYTRIRTRYTTHNYYIYLLKLIISVQVHFKLWEHSAHHIIEEMLFLKIFFLHGSLFAFCVKLGRL